MSGGLALRVWSARTLGAAYSRTLRTTTGQDIASSGPYSHIRHPGYAGALCLWAGYGVALTSIPASAAAIAPTAVAYLRRIHVEEAMLREQLGEPYGAYQERTARLVPGVF